MLVYFRAERRCIMQTALIELVTLTSGVCSSAYKGVCPLPAMVGYKFCSVHKCWAEGCDSAADMNSGQGLCESHVQTLAMEKQELLVGV